MKTTETERTAVFGYVDETRLDETMARQQDKDKFALGSIAKGVPNFIKETGYTTFLAEHVMRDGNLVFHFFYPTDLKLHPDRARVYWERSFAVALDEVAQRVFQATAPRLQAKYTEEMKSWWFRACSYDHIIDVQGFVRQFFDELDTALEQKLAFATEAQPGA